MLTQLETKQSPNPTVGYRHANITPSRQWRSMILSTPGLLLMALPTYLVMGSVIFVVAGRVDLPWVWMALIVQGVSHLAMVLLVFRRDPDLARERLAPGPGAPVWDKFILWSSGFLMLASIVAAALDVGRLHWSDSIPSIVQFGGLIGIVLGMALLTWAMAVNTFFSKTVRIQEDRGHRVIESGPYRIVRHPGYVGWLVLWVAFNLALGSWLAVGVSLSLVGVILLRTAWEDQFLQRRLAGYVEYSRRVKWRLLPGIW